MAIYNNAMELFEDAKQKVALKSNAVELLNPFEVKKSQPKNAIELFNTSAAKASGLIEDEYPLNAEPVINFEPNRESNAYKLLKSAEEEVYKRYLKANTVSISKIESENVINSVSSALNSGQNIKEPLPKELEAFAKSFQYERGAGTNYSTEDIVNQLKEGTYYKDPNAIQSDLDAYKTFGKELVSKVPTAIAVTIFQALQPNGASVTNRGYIDNFIKWANDDLDSFAQEAYNRFGDKGFAGLKLTDLAELPRNLGYSLTSMGSGLISGIFTGPMAGSTISGAVAYNATKYQIMQQYLEAKNEESIAKFGREITFKEEEQLKLSFNDQAKKYALWEAVPEAISNFAMFNILTAPLTKMVGKGIAGKIVTKLAGLFGEEFATEGLTQMGQAGIEIKAGMREGPPINWFSINDWTRAFKEIAPQTFLLTTLMAGAGTTGLQINNAASKIKNSLKNEIGMKHELYQPLLDKINVMESGDISSEILLEGELPMSSQEPGGTGSYEMPESITFDDSNFVSPEW